MLQSEKQSILLCYYQLVCFTVGAKRHFVGLAPNPMPGAQVLTFGCYIAFLI